MAELQPYLDAVRPGILTHVTGFYDQHHNEYWLHIFDGPHEGQDFAITNTLVYSPNPEIKAWTSNYDYIFDRMAMNGKRAYGSKDGITYLLDSGFEINGSPVSFEITFASSPDPSIKKEYERIRANSEVKPTRIEFYDINENLLCTMDQATQGQYYLKNYDGWEQGIPRKVGGNRDRIQERVCLCKIIHDDGTSFTLHTAGMQIKPLK